MGGNSRGREPKIVHILKSRNRFRDLRPCSDRPMEVGAIWPKSVDEMARADMAELDIRVDMRYGDPFMCVLRKARYVIENIDSAFQVAHARERCALNIISIVRDYGAQEGVPVLKTALELFGESVGVRSAISTAAARIGGPDDYPLLVECVCKDAENPDAHRGALAEFLERFPGLNESMKSAISLLPSGGRILKTLEGCGVFL